MPEYLSDLGYLAVAKETVTKGVPSAIPSIYVPLYKDGIKIMLNSSIDTPIVGQKYTKYQILPGMRNYGGTVEIMGEPNTAALFFDMMLNKSGTTGSNPYTHAFSLNATNPNSYTVDIAKGPVVYRYLGVEASEIKPTFVNNEMHLNCKLHALRSFADRGIATISTTSITLDTKFTPAPNVGLQVGDLVQITSATGSPAALSTTVSSVNIDGITVVLGASAAAFAGGSATINIRPATPSLNVLAPFLFSSTQFCFGATAAAALSAAHTPMEETSEWTIMHKFAKDQGEHRSGSQDPASLLRTLGDVDMKLKKYFSNTTDQDNFQNIAGQGLVVRHYAGANNQYELRCTFNDIRIMDGADPALNSGQILYSDMKVAPALKAADGQAFDVKCINSLSTI
jgi:hypothetical protein